MLADKPQSWRDGQTLFNFLEWLQTEKGVPAGQSHRMADAFFLPDDKLSQYYQEFLEVYGR